MRAFQVRSSLSSRRRGGLCRVVQPYEAPTDTGLGCRRGGDLDSGKVLASDTD